MTLSSKHTFAQNIVVGRGAEGLGARRVVAQSGGLKGGSPKGGGPQLRFLFPLAPLGLRGVPSLFFFPPTVLPPTSLWAPTDPLLPPSPLHFF